MCGVWAFRVTEFWGEREQFLPELNSPAGHLSVIGPVLSLGKGFHNKRHRVVLEI